MTKRANKPAAKPQSKPTKRASAVKAAPKPARKPAEAAALSVATDAITAAVATLNAALSRDEIDAVPVEAVQKLMAAVLRVYSAKVQSGEYFLPFDPGTGRVAPTDVMIATSNILKAADLQVFELGMWQSFTGR